MTTQTLKDLVDQAETLQQFKADYVALVSDFHFDDACNAVMNGTNIGSPADVYAVPTDHAFSQLCTKLGVSAFGKGGRGLPADFMRAIPKDWAAMNLNAAIARMPAKSGWTMRTFQGAGEQLTSARAFMDKSYYDFDNTDMLRILGGVLIDKGTDYRLSAQSYAHADSMRVDAIMGYEKRTDGDAGGNKEWMWGVGLRNDEIGNGSGGCLSLLKRGKCDNTVAVDLEGFNYTFRHWASRDETRARYKTEMYVAVGNILPHAKTLIEEMLQADYDKLPDFSRLVEGCSVLNGWGDDLVGHIWEGAEGAYTRGGLINGVTYAAQFAKGVEQRFDMELFGGAILVTPDSVFGMAENALAKVEQANAREEAKQTRMTQRQQQRGTRR